MRKKNSKANGSVKAKNISIYHFECFYLLSVTPLLLLWGLWKLTMVGSMWYRKPSTHRYKKRRGRTQCQWVRVSESNLSS